MEGQQLAEMIRMLGASTSHSFHLLLALLSFSFLLGLCLLGGFRQLRTGDRYRREFRLELIVQLDIPCFNWLFQLLKVHHRLFLCERGLSRKRQP